jgi:transcriptional regulator with XRE-family HTH domain
MKISGEQIVQRIDDLLEDSDLTRADLCRDVGIHPGAMTNWIKQGNIPAADTICLIAKQLHTSAEYLVLGKTQNNLSVEALAIARQWEVLDEIRQIEVQDFIYFLVTQRAKKTAREIKRNMKK